MKDYARVRAVMEEEGVTLSELVEYVSGIAPPPNKPPEGVWGNLYIRPLEFSGRGSRVETHTHNFDHITMLSSGVVEVCYRDTKTGAEGTRVYRAPTFFLVPAHYEHQFTALTDDTIAFCVFAHRGFDGEVVERFNGYMAAYE